MLYLTKGKKGAPFTGLYLEDLKNETLEVFFFWTVSFSGALQQKMCMRPHLLECAFLCNTLQCKRWFQSTQSPDPAHPQAARTLVCK